MSGQQVGYSDALRQATCLELELFLQELLVVLPEGEIIRRDEYLQLAVAMLRLQMITLLFPLLLRAVIRLYIDIRCKALEFPNPVLQCR